MGFSINDIRYPEIPNDRVILLNYTSGTTGYSKGAVPGVLSGLNVRFSSDKGVPVNAFSWKTGVQTGFAFRMVK